MSKSSWLIKLLFSERAVILNLLELGASNPNFSTEASTLLLHFGLMRDK